MMSLPTSPADLERFGPNFDAEQMLAVRDMTRKAINQIAKSMRPGMVEEDAVEIAKDILAEAGMTRGWHDVYVRFGSNTTKTFGAPSDPGVILGADDIFLIDIGPVWKKWEGDGGDTFTTGTNQEYARCPKTPERYSMWYASIGQKTRPAARLCTASLLLRLKSAAGS